VPAQPEQLRRGEPGQRPVAGQLDQAAQADALLDLAALLGCAPVVPEDRGTQDAVAGVEADEAVHLAGQAHRVGLRQFGEYLSGGADPVLRILLRPARLRGRERILALRARDHLAGGVERERFHAGRADVEPDDHGTAQAPSAAYTSS
jgi:hypothetical protein